VVSLPNIWGHTFLHSVTAVREQIYRMQIKQIDEEHSGMKLVDQ
jgi:hypothetical protein